MVVDWLGIAVQCTKLTARSFGADLCGALLVPADCAVMLRWLTGTIISGDGARPNRDIEKIIGRFATSFRDFAERNAAAWASQPVAR